MMRKSTMEELACYSAACAPPPAGTGGSIGGGKSKGGNTRVKNGSGAVAKKAPAAGGGSPKGKIQSQEHTSTVKGKGKMEALTKTTKYKDGSTEIHVAVEHSRYYGRSTTLTVKSKGKTIAKVFNDDDPPPSKAAVNRMLKEAKRYDDPNDLAGNLINEGGWQDYGP